MGLHGHVMGSMGLGVGVNSNVNIQVFKRSLVSDGFLLDSYVDGWVWVQWWGWVLGCVMGPTGLGTGRGSYVYISKYS